MTATSPRLSDFARRGPEGFLQQGTHIKAYRFRLRGPSAATVLAGAALFIALGGTAWALVVSHPTRAGARPLPAPRRVTQPQPQERDQRLGVLALRDRVVEARQRPAHDLDPLALVAFRVGILAQLGREV